MAYQGKHIAVGHKPPSLAFVHWQPPQLIPSLQEFLWMSLQLSESLKIAMTKLL